MRDVGNFFSGIFESLNNVKECSRQLRSTVGNCDGAADGPNDFGHVSMVVFSRRGLSSFEDDQERMTKRTKRQHKIWRSLVADTAPHRASIGGAFGWSTRSCTLHAYGGGDAS